MGVSWRCVRMGRDLSCITLRVRGRRGVTACGKVSTPGRHLCGRVAPVDVVLVRVQQDGRSSNVPLRRPRTVVGRQTDCNLRVPAVDVSRRHCEVTQEGDSLTVRDLGSRNGTFVNGQKVEGSVPLAAGDVLTVGPLVFVVRVDGEPEVVDAAEMHRRGKPMESDSSSDDDADEPTKVGRVGAARAAGESPKTGGGLMDDVGLSSDPDDSSVVEFDFDFGDDDDEEQPPL